ERDFSAGGIAGSGLVRLVSGKSGSQITYFAGNAGSSLGAAVAGQIDLDGDGYLDVLVGAPLDNSAAYHGGAVFGYSPHLNTFPGAWFGPAAAEQVGSSGRSPAAAGDGGRGGRF